MKILYQNQTGALLASFLVTLGVFAALTMISIPAYNKFKPNLQLSGATRDLIAELRYAQQLTLAEQTVYGIEINDPTDSYHLININTSTTTLKSVELPPEVSIQSSIGFSDNVVRFNSFGAVKEAGEIILENTIGEIKTISIKPSGYVESY